VHPGTGHKLKEGGPYKKAGSSHRKPLLEGSLISFFHFASYGVMTVDQSSSNCLKNILVCRFFLF